MQIYIKFFQIFTLSSIFFHIFYEQSKYTLIFRCLNFLAMKKYGYLILLAALAFSCGRSPQEEPACMQIQEQEELIQNEYGIPAGKFRGESGMIGKGDFFGPLLLRLGADNNRIQQLTEAGKDVFDVTKIKIGNHYEAFYAEDDPGRLAYFVYERDRNSHIVFGLDSLSVRVVEKEMETERKYAQVTINSSLWNDVQAAGVSPLLALEIADIYAWTIDFFGLQKGDSFRVVFDELTYKGEPAGIGNVQYVQFVHQSKLYEAYHFHDGNRGGHYWNEKGESLKKAFLKAPLNFTRVSSGFTYARRHPVTRVVRPHTGVDYAAPKGTPVWSIGDGVVISRGWSGGGGNTVKIKHNSVYTTAYMHLSAYAKGLKTGQRVKQGEIIGYVGSTGVSTGPHLDFRVWKNGTPINPLTMESPASEPVSGENMALFENTVSSLRYQMDSLMSAKYVDRLLENLM